MANLRWIDVIIAYFLINIPTLLILGTGLFISNRRGLNFRTSSTVLGLVALAGSFFAVFLAMFAWMGYLLFVLLYTLLKTPTGATTEETSTRAGTFALRDRRLIVCGCGREWNAAVLETCPSCGLGESLAANEPFDSPNSVS